ncbi:MAG: alpha/beta fold hydrolase [Steroidobacteraceae bacterium]
MAPRILAASGVSMVAALGACAPDAEQGIRPRTRAEALEIVSGLRRIVSPEGVDRLEAVNIGGMDQWISIRGTDLRNPILLFIHGGPGYVSMPTSWYFQRGWEEFFTVVNWDQRGAGKTYVGNYPQAVWPTLTIERMVADAEELIAWLRREYGRDRIFVLGHSWGSLVGLTVARRHPEWLHAYIGMGQITDFRESERRGWRFAMDAARAENNAEAMAALEAIAPYAEETPPTLTDLLVQRRWVGHYGGAIYRRADSRDFTRAASLAPEYSDEDVRRVWIGNQLSVERILPELLAAGDLTGITQLECPLILLSGRHDYNVSSSAAEEWYQRLRAPSKTLVWFEQSAHEPLNEEPGRMLMALVTHARPIAERAGDVPD